MLITDLAKLSIPSHLSCSWSFMVFIIHHFRRKKTWISVEGWVQTVECGDLIEIVYECVVSHIWTHCHTLCLSRHLTSFKTRHVSGGGKDDKPVLHIHPCIHNALPDYFLTPTKSTIRSDCTGRWLKYRHENAVCFRVFNAKKKKVYHLSVSLSAPPSCLPWVSCTISLLPFYLL